MATVTRIAIGAAKVKIIEIGRGYAAKVDDEKYEEIAAYSWKPLIMKNRKGDISIVYAHRWTSAKDGISQHFYMHRQIMGVTDSKTKVDHRDHDGLNNTISNLRACSHVQNLQNQRMRVDNSSGYKGVSWYAPTKKWRARIYFRSKFIFIGYFFKKEDAARAYENKAKELFGDFYCTENITSKRVA
jgi:HNH endonuclease